MGCLCYRPVVPRCSFISSTGLHPGQLSRQLSSGLGSWTTKAPGLLKRAAGLSAEPAVEAPNSAQGTQDDSSAPEKPVRCLITPVRPHAHALP
jgi:hypothetical protein